MTPETKERIENDKTVGQRDLTDNPPYIEFFTRPFTKIEFSGEDGVAELRKMQTLLLDFGWKTLDFS